MIDEPQLMRVIDTLCVRFADRPRDVIEGVVRAAYAELSLTATITTHLAALTQHLAADRLAARHR